MNDPLERLVDDIVVLDTATPILYIGTLVEVTEHALTLRDADMHDCRDGHANKELYLADTCRDGVTPNRRTIVVARAAVISVSPLADVVTD